MISIIQSVEVCVHAANCASLLHDVASCALAFQAIPSTRKQNKELHQVIVIVSATAWNRKSFSCTK